MNDLQHVKGLNDLSRKLSALGKDLGGKTLRQSAMNATTPVLKSLKAAAPRGKGLHKTYKGRTVFPGFLSRSLKRKSFYRNGKARIAIGVKKEAFYGLQFVEKGTDPHDIPKKRKFSAFRERKKLAFGGRIVSRVKHPGAKAKPWFEKTFVSNKGLMVSRFADQLQMKIDRLSKK